MYYSRPFKLENQQTSSIHPWQHFNQHGQDTTWTIQQQQQQQETVSKAGMLNNFSKALGKFKIFLLLCLYVKFSLVSAKKIHFADKT